MEPICASELREFPRKHKASMIEQTVKSIYRKVLDVARYKTSHYEDVLYSRNVITSDYIPTAEEIVTYLKEIFIDCKIEYVEERLIHRGVETNTIAKKGILIDWS